MRIAAFVFFVSVACAAQTATSAPPKHFLLSQIKVAGSQRYSPDQIAAALQLKIGTQVSQPDLEAASQRLGNSGLFQLVQYKFGWQGNGLMAEFDVADASSFVPVGFENFVWFTPPELDQQIKSKLPLYSGIVPLAGGFRDQLQDALQQIIAAHNLHGTVTVTPLGSLTGPIQGMLYSVDGNHVKITSCDFSGAEHADITLLTRLTAALQSSDYQKSFVDATTRTRLKDIYDAQGYLGAKFGAPEIKITSQTPDETGLAVTVKVEEGQLYKLAGVQWSGNTVHSSDELTKLIKIDSGQPASLPKFKVQLEAVHKLYGQNGYVGLRMDVDPILDPQGSAIFNVKIAEGEPYHMGSLAVRGIDPQTLSKLTAEWKMKEGDIYDASYPDLYMTTKFGKYVPMGLRIEWTKHEMIHDDKKTVDLLMDVGVKPHS
jgi:outer membrane protein insertion porin family